MRSAGWFKEPWRHGLAARGVKTKYYSSKGGRGLRYFAETQTVAQEKVAQKGRDDTEVERALRLATRLAVVSRGRDEEAKKGERTTQEARQLQRLKDKESLETFERERSLNRTDKVRVAIAAIKGGRLEVVGSDGQLKSVGSFIQSENLAPAEKLQLSAAVNEQAILLAQAEQPVPKEYEGVLTNTTRAQIKALQEQQKIAGRSTSRQFLADAGKGVAIGAGDALVGAGERVAAAPGQVVGAAREGLDEAGQPRGLGLFGGAQPSPRGKAEASGPSLFSDNPFLGGPNIATSGGNVALGTGPGGQKVDQYPEAKVANREVDELYGAKSRLKDVDLSGFQKGKASFKKGDREGLIRSINALEAEEQKLRDRWTMVEQTRSVLLNPRTRAATLRQEEGSFSLFGGSRGGSAVADQTQKLNDVKREIKESANEAYARRVVLQGDLQRLDAQVKPVTDAPRDVAVFKDDVGVSGGAASLRGSLDWYKGLGK